MFRAIGTVFGYGVPSERRLVCSCWWCVVLVHKARLTWASHSKAACLRKFTSLCHYLTFADVIIKSSFHLVRTLARVLESRLSFGIDVLFRGGLALVDSASASGGSGDGDMAAPTVPITRNRRTQRDQCGNGMHIAVIGSVIAALMLAVDKIGRTRPATSRSSSVRSKFATTLANLQHLRSL
jgi:hypothetical protein